jgi:lipoprotein-anchoring transpeptidase ErfK/SrfK
VLALAACTGAQDPGGSGSPVAKTSSNPATTSTTTTTSAAPSTPTHTAAPAAAITTSVTTKSGVNPAAPISVQVADGTLSSVQLINPQEDRVVHGKLDTGHTSWHSTEALGYGKSYRLSATAVNSDGKKTTTSSSFSTLTPGNMTMPYFQTIGGYALRNHATYGVGIVPIVHFDEHVTNKKAAEKALHVTTTPHVDGSWYWVDDQNVHWRAKGYYRPGTKVTIAADVYGIDVGDNLYGQSDKSVSFTIGRYQKTVADDTRKGPGRVKVYNGAGKVIRTMDTSMGQHSGTTVNGNYINYYTLDGAYTVIAHENPANMCSDSYGLPANAPGGYPCEKIYWSTKISVDGIYLHQLNTTLTAQKEGVDVSHGCLNLNLSNAKWFYTHSLLGDPVIVKGAKKAPKIEMWQGGDWSVPWSTWLAGSALH